MRRLVLYIAIVFLSLLAGAQFSSASEYDDAYGEEDFILDETGEITSTVPAKREATSMSVTFTNGAANETIDLFWMSSEGEQVFIAEIGPLETAPVNTFAGHMFVAKPKESQMTLIPKLITMESGKRSHRFAPVGSADMGFRPQTEKPFIRHLHSPTTAASAKFRNIIPTKVDVWYDDGKSGVPQGTLALGNEYTVNTYEGHVFYFTEHGNKQKVLARHTVKKDQVLYVVEDKARPPPAEMVEHIRKEEAFMKEYLAKTGREWRHYYGPDGPRGPPQMFMWPADFDGQKHSVETTENYWTCLGPASECHPPLSRPIVLNLTVVSREPRAFFIENFLSSAEADAIIQTAAPRMAESYVGNKDGGGARKSETRTSRNAWVGREVNAYTETLFRRAEQLLKIPRLDRSNTEDMQVVHYTNGQKYDSHHDWGVSGYPESRYITLLLYLTDMAAPDAGGETSFPKGGEGGAGIKIHPGRCNAVLFYNLLPDGNGDDLSLHAALPVVKGEKWMANFWVWDPKRR